MHALILMAALSAAPVVGYDRLPFGSSSAVARAVYPDLKFDPPAGKARAAERPVEVVGLVGALRLVFVDDRLVMALVFLPAADPKQAEADFSRVEKGLTEKYGRPEVGESSFDLIRKRPPGEVDHTLRVSKDGKRRHMLAYFDPAALPPDLTGSTDTRGL